MIIIKCDDSVDTYGPSVSAQTTQDTHNATQF